MFANTLSVEDKYLPRLEEQIDREFAAAHDVNQYMAVQELEAKLVSSNQLKAYLKQYGLTAAVLWSLDPTGNTVAYIGTESLSNEIPDSIRKAQLTQTILNRITEREDSLFDEAGGLEGLRELLHNPTFQKFGPMLASFLVPTESFAQRDAAKALKAAKASGDAKAIDVAQKAFDGVKAGFMKGLLRAVVIGVIAESLIRAGVKVADKIVNADRVYGTAGQVSANLNTIKSMLAKAENLAKLTVATDGSNVDDIKKQAEDFLDEVKKLYKGSQSYTMTKGSQSGWTQQNIPALAKQFDDIVNNTDGLSKSIDSVIDGTVAAGKNSADKAIEEAINERNKALIKSLKLIHKLANTTTRVFDDLKKFINHKGLQEVDKAASTKTESTPAKGQE